ncbi:hypothetical protein FOZ60_001978 [Perkinsus olseni]|nr:hypothetical protein FOZ60_001978 [Perkinsus olseni]
MTYLPIAAGKVVMKFRWLLKSRATLILATGIASVLAFKALKLIIRSKVHLHACFGGPKWFLPGLGFLPKSLDHMHRALEIFADTYGSIYCVKVTGMDVVVLSDPNLIRQVLKERPNNFTRFGNEDKILPFSGMFTAEGEEWKRNRRLGAPAFNEKNSTAMITDMSRVALKLVRQLSSLTRERRIVWSPTEWIPLCTLDVLCITSLGNDYNFLNPDGLSLGHRSRVVQQAINDTMAGSGYAVTLGYFPWMTRDRFPWNLNPMIHKLHAGLKRLRGNCDEIIRERLEERRAGERDKRRDLLDKLLDLDREDLLGNLIT